MSLALLQTALFLPAEFLLNQLLALDTASAARLAALDGRTLAVHVSSPNLDLYISIRNRKLHLSPVFEGGADAQLFGTASNLLRVLVQQTPVSNLAPFKVELQGSTAFMQNLQNLLKDLDIDWEFHLSQLIGDLPVAGMRKGMDVGGEFTNRTAKNTLNNIRDYLNYECDIIPAKSAAEQFYTDITELTLRADRLQAKISTMQN